LDLPQPETKKKGKKKVEIDPEIVEQARQVALYKRELATYGVSFHLIVIIIAIAYIITLRIIIIIIIIRVFAVNRGLGSGRTTTRKIKTRRTSGMLALLLYAESTCKCSRTSKTLS